MRISKCLAIICLLSLMLTGCLSANAAAPPLAPYGVLIGANPEDMEHLPAYRTVVIDAEYFPAEEIAALRKGGSKVWSYLNIGSVETFRDVYPAFSTMTLGPYENWQGEYWMDVSRPEWREYLVDTAAKALDAKDVDGFFLDNADVYYEYPESEIFDGLAAIINGLGQYGKDIILNGGDVFVSAAALEPEKPLVSITGVNQECVFTAIDFDGGAFTRQGPETTDYYLAYLDKCKESGIAAYLTEYATADQKNLRRDIAEACAGRGYVCYTASSVELDGKP